MTNLPMPRTRWVIASTARNEVECQRIRQWLERKGIAVRVQSVIVASSKDVGAQLKVFVPSSDLRKAQAIIKENHHRGRTFMGGGSDWLQSHEMGRLLIIIAIIMALAMGSLLLRIW